MYGKQLIKNAIVYGRLENKNILYIISNMYLFLNANLKEDFCILNKDYKMLKNVRYVSKIICS
jgi:hypothetical protein